MAPSYTMISQLLKNSDTAVIHVRVTRIWKSFNPHDNKLLHTNAIFFYEEVRYIKTKFVYHMLQPLSIE